jgi:hypothetical protein
MQMMPMRDVGVMPCRLVMILLMMLGGFFMVLRSLLVMFGGLETLYSECCRRMKTVHVLCDCRLTGH